MIKSLNDIKLVIWDLDDTFWKGTLSERGGGNCTYSKKY